MSEAARVPGTGRYVLAGALALGGILAAAGLVAWLVLTWEEGTQFLAPGRQALTLNPGEHVVWNDHVTVFEGRSYRSSKDLPDGVQVTVTGSGGVGIALRRASGATYKGFNTERVAVMKFDIARPGRYEIAIQGDFQPRVFSVGPDHTGALLWTAFGAIALLFLGFGAGIGVAAWAFIRLESHFRWQIRTFWYSLLWFGVGLALLIVVVGVFVLMALAMWLLYRAIKGWLSLEEGKPIYA